jgi:hypothetical protein
MFKKEDFDRLDSIDLLEKIAELPVSRWKYKGVAESHIGPMAQDFFRIFQVGVDDKTISTIDPSGIALAAIKGLYAKYKAALDHNSQIEARIKSLEDITADQATRLQRQDAAIAALMKRVEQLETSKKDQ